MVQQTGDTSMDFSDPKFWAFIAVSVPGLLAPVAIALWKGRGIGAIALLSLVFWPGALVLALRLPRRLEKRTRYRRPL